MALNLQNYEEVKDRIPAFLTKYPSGRITTSLMEHGTDMAWVVFRAELWTGDILLSTGWAYEAKGQGVNKDAWVENCETSAIGRALANLAIHAGPRPSREEMSKVQETPAGEETLVLPTESRRLLVARVTKWAATLPEEQKAVWRGKLSMAKSLVEMEVLNEELDNLGAEK